MEIMKNRELSLWHVLDLSFLGSFAGGFIMWFICVVIFFIWDAISPLGPFSGIFLFLPAIAFVVTLAAFIPATLIFYRLSRSPSIDPSLYNMKLFIFFGFLFNLSSLLIYVAVGYITSALRIYNFELLFFILAMVLALLASIAITYFILTTLTQRNRRQAA